MVDPVPKSFDADNFFKSFLAETTTQRQEELESLVSTWNVRFQLDETSVVADAFWCEPKTGLVNIPRLCLFRLKAHAYAYFSAFNCMVAKKSGQIDSALDGRLAAASELLTWAVRTDFATFDDDGSIYSFGHIPPELNSLLRSCVVESESVIAEHVFRMAVAYILHHELAHIRFQHLSPPGPDSKREEFEADREAIDWLLHADDEASTGSAMTSERLGLIYGLVVGFGWIASFGAYIGVTDEEHPPECQRLLSGITHMANSGSDDAEFAWGIAQMILLFHAQRAGLSVSAADMAGSFEDIARRLVGIIEESHI